MAEEEVSEVQTHRTAAAEALSVHDNKGANAAYQAELKALEGQTPDGDTVEDNQGLDDPGAGDKSQTGLISDESIEEIYTELSSEFGPESVDTLRGRWGNDAGENIALVQALVEDHPELNDIASDFGLQDHPGLIALAAHLARNFGYSFDNINMSETIKEPSVENNSNTGNNIDQEAFSKTMRDFNSRISLAQSEGNSKLANTIYAKQLDWLASVKGNQPIVGSKQRTA